jgi:hypothetical protein
MSLDHSNNAYAAALAASARTPEQFKVPPRAYFHQHPHAKFHFDLGGSRVKTVSFAGGVYVTDDKREQDQLDLVVDVPGAFIYQMKDSEVAAAMARELQNEQRTEVMKTAQAVAAAHGQQFDPNSPIVAVNTGHTPQGLAIVGAANSFSGTQATQPMTATPTTPASQTSAQQTAIQQLNKMAEEAKAKQS